MTPEDHNGIVARFFEAIAELKKERRIGGVATFARNYGISKQRLYDAKKDPIKHGFRAVWLTYLVRDFNISAAWLLTGEGQMYE